MFSLSAIQIFTQPITKGDVTSLVLLLLFIGFPEVQPVMDPGYCTAYCTNNDQQKDSFSCPRINDTIDNFLCCGSAVFKYCCSTPMDKAPFLPTSYCATKITYDWIIILAIVMTTVIFVLGLTGCLCVCHKKCRCKNIVCSETGEPEPLSEAQPDSAVHSSTATDFDPSSPCAFAPPAYDTLPKDPPAYSEVFTISNGCSFNSPSNQTPTNFQMESICNSFNQSHPLPEYTSSTTHQETVLRVSNQSAVDHQSPPYQPPTVSSDPAPPSYSPRPTRRTHRPSMSLAIEMHPLNLGVTGNQLSSPAQDRVLPAAV